MSVYFKRNLPHYHIRNATYFVTFRLAGSLPIEAWKKLQAEYEREKSLLAKQLRGDALYEARAQAQHRYFVRFDELLESYKESPRWLAEPRLAEIVRRQLHTLHPQQYFLYAYCIMSNHVHVLMDQDGIPEPPPHAGGKHYTALSRAMRLLKGGSGYECAQALGRKGAFWQHESYDHVVRNERDFERILNYIANNPVKAGLVSRWDEWPYTYIHPDLLPS